MIRNRFQKILEDRTALLGAPGDDRIAIDRAREILGSLALECLATVRPRGPPCWRDSGKYFWLLQGIRRLITTMRLATLVFVVCAVWDNSECFRDP